MVGAGDQRSKSCHLQPEEGRRFLCKLFTQAALFCAHFSIGATYLRLLFLLGAVNIPLLFIPIFYTSQGRFHVLTHSSAQATCDPQQGDGLS